MQQPPPDLRSRLTTAGIIVLVIFVVLVIAAAINDRNDPAPTPEDKYGQQLADLDATYGYGIRARQAMRRRGIRVTADRCTAMYDATVTLAGNSQKKERGEMFFNAGCLGKDPPPTKSGPFTVSSS